MDSDYLMISGIQHFSFCRRQWALIHIEEEWKENQLTAEGRIIHDRVHDNQLITQRRGVITVRGIPVRSERLKITGQCDAVELIQDKDGIELKGRIGKWSIHPVEYKRGNNKINDCDRLQLAAECVCLEEMLSCEISSGSIYYGQTKRREEVHISSELREQLEEVLEEMHSYYARGYTPKVKPTTSCKSCSLKDICIPDLIKKQDPYSYIKSHVQEEEV